MKDIQKETDLDGMQMFEEAQINPSTFVMRVPGGLMMRYEARGDIWDPDQGLFIENLTGVTSCFIPWASLPVEQSDEPVAPSEEALSETPTEEAPAESEEE